jgi:hypothetical protein
MLPRSLRDRIPLAVCLTAVSFSVATAQTPAATQTFWNWMGVPKEPLSGVVNRQGNFPMCEKKPKLLRLADPQNLESKNPAIKKAAEIKAEEDLAAQKIKAIKYLGEIGCQDCYEGVDDALLAALDDCTEAVRYEAVKVILERALCGSNNACLEKCMNKTKTCKEYCEDVKVNFIKGLCGKMHLLCGKPGPDGVTIKSKLPGFACGMVQPDNKCNNCGCRGNCCSDKMTKKLVDLAYDRDEHGCYKEPSPRVRALALQAIKACNPNPRPMIYETVEADEEIVAPVPEKEVAEPETKEQATPGEEKAAPAEKEEAVESLPEASVLTPSVTEVTSDACPAQPLVESFDGQVPGFTMTTVIPAAEQNLENEPTEVTENCGTPPVANAVARRELRSLVAPQQTTDMVVSESQSAKRFRTYGSSEWTTPAQPQLPREIAVIGPSGLRERLEAWGRQDEQKQSRAEVAVMGPSGMRERLEAWEREPTPEHASEQVAAISPATIRERLEKWREIENYR